MPRHSSPSCSGACRHTCPAGGRDGPIRAARSFNASDLHLSVGRSPFVRLFGILRELDGPELTADDTEAVAFALAGPEREEEMRRAKQGEFLLKDEDRRRYRCCAIKQRLGWDLSIRLIGETIPTPEELGIPKVLLRLTEYQQGLVLITGPGGSGKTSLLHILAGLDRPTAGSVTLDERNLRGLDDIELTRLRRDRIGLLLPAASVLPTITVRENVALPLLVSGVAPEERAGLGPYDEPPAVR